MAQFPGAIPTLTNPTSSDNLNTAGVVHSTQHANANDEIEAIASKFGTGASTPAAGTVLRGTGAGTSAWQQVATGDIAAQAVTQMVAAALSSDFSTTSTTLVDVTGASVTLITTGGDVLLLFSGPAHATTQGAQFQIAQDGVDNGATLISLTPGGLANVPISLVFRYPAPAAGSHTYKLRAKVTSGGTLTMNFAAAANGMWMVVELKK